MPQVGKPVTEACLEGYNGTIFCYGQVRHTDQDECCFPNYPKCRTVSGGLVNAEIDASGWELASVSAPNFLSSVTKATQMFPQMQTGSGKTFTTFGPGAVMENHLNPGDPKSYALRGLVPRVLEYLYDTIKSRVENGGGKVGEIIVGGKMFNGM